MKQDLQINEETLNSKPTQIADEACFTYAIHDCCPFRLLPGEMRIVNPAAKR